MKRSVVLALCLFEAPLSGQFSMREIPYPPGGSTGTVSRLETAPDGRLWVVSNLGPTQVVMGQKTLGSTVDLGIAGSVGSSNVIFTKKSISGTTAEMSSFSPQDGEVITFAPATATSVKVNGANVTVYKDFDFQASLTPLGLKSVCSSYTVDGGGAPTTISGPSYYAGLQPQFPGLYQVNFVVPGQPAAVLSALQVQGTLVAGDVQTKFQTVMSQGGQ